MSKLLSWLVQACDELGLHVDREFKITLDGEHVVHAVARVRGLGAENGMLVISDYDEVKAHLAEISKAGYGFSILDEPSSQEEYDLESYAQMFRDWGWSGTETPRPLWM
jgi:signal transduction histidine kinase